MAFRPILIQRRSNSKPPSPAKRLGPTTPRILSGPITPQYIRPSFNYPTYPSTLQRKIHHLLGMEAKSKTPKRTKSTSSRLHSPTNSIDQITSAYKHGPMMKQTHRRVKSHLIRKSPLHDKEKTHTRKFSLELGNGCVNQYAFATHVGYIPGNPEKQNQDAFIITPGIGLNSRAYFFAVADGHGFFGAEVSKMIKTRLPSHLAADPFFMKNNKKALTSAIERTVEELMQSQIDCNFSGSTLVSVLVEGYKLWCANIGDSRALLARMMPEKAPGSSWMSISLSRDHKPDDADEQARIEAANGRVESYTDEEGNPLGPARVWLKDQDIPGLAMSRSIGDGCAASVGCIHEPEFLEMTVVPEDKFIVVGSDGIFEFLSNEEVVKIVVPYWKIGDVKGAAEKLMQEAQDRWVVEEEVIDDITCVIVFLNTSEQ